MSDNDQADERRAYGVDNHERLVRVEVKQDMLNKAFDDHEVHDEERFSEMNALLRTITNTQVKLSTTMWLVGGFITLMVPVITALVIHFSSVS